MSQLQTSEISKYTSSKAFIYPPSFLCILMLYYSNVTNPVLADKVSSCSARTTR
jgi:hypothetical protein